MASETKDLFKLTILYMTANDLILPATKNTSVKSTKYRINMEEFFCFFLKKEVNLTKKRKISILLTFLILCLFFCIPAFADEKDEWGGWTDEKKEEAWTVYAATDWKSMNSYLNFGTEGSSATADVPNSIRIELEDTIRETLKGISIQQGAYPNECYTELMLVIADQLNPILMPKYDIFHGNTFINPDFEVTSREQSTRWAFYRLTFCEGYYNANSSTAVDLYVTDNALKVVVQGLIYGTDYVKEMAANGTEYSKESAEKYFEAHKNSYTFTKSYADFAEKVIAHYSTVKAIGNITNWESE